MSGGLGGSWQQDLQGCVLGGAIGGAASVTGGREGRAQGTPWRRARAGTSVSGHFRITSSHLFASP